ncbi:MAG: hypothetical protein FJW35_04075 [Acidobacteria bacterium]|nr:hypothetical protein [Acidobacteriota bacterium]
MKAMGRRNFFTTTMIAVPGVLLATAKQSREIAGDPVSEQAISEFSRIAQDIALQNRVAPDHIRRFAGTLRIFDAHMEAAGVHDRMYRHLDGFRAGEIPYDLIDAAWKKHGVNFNRDYLGKSLRVTPDTVRRGKRMLRENRGVLYLKLADGLERFAANSMQFAPAAVLLRPDGVEVTGAGGPAIRPASDDDSWDCLCAAMVVEGYVLAFLCAAGLVVTCVPAAAMLGIVALMEVFNFCDSKGCFAE